MSSQLSQTSEIKICTQHMNPSFRSVWVYNLTNGIPGNSTDVQLAYGWTEHTDHIKELLVSQHKERSRLEREIQQIPVKQRGGFVTAVPTAPPAEWGLSTGAKLTYRAGRTTAFLVWVQLHWKPHKACCPQCQGTKQLRHSLCTTLVFINSAN